MNEQVKNELEIIKESVLNAVPASAMYLFGSHAYGEPNNESDLDIYVVVPDKSMCDMDTRVNLSIDIRKRISKPIDLFIRDKNSFDYRISAPTLERKIYREGVKFYG